MAKKKSEQPTEEERQSRKEILLERKQREQMRSIRIGAAIVLGLIVLVLIVALVNEFFIAPNRAVAIVNGENITLSDWQERVRFERAQRIIGLENQLELLGGNVGQVQQFSGQTIVELQEGQTLGEQTLDQMVNEELIRQGAEEREISVTDAEVEARIGSFFNYFGGDVPTPQPTPTQTIMPTPSLTPIPTEVITDVVPTQTPFPTPTIGPTSTPLPTPTPVSEEAYLAELDELVGRFVDLGVSESLYRELIRTQIYSEKLTDALVDEQDFTGEAPHASLFLLLFNDAEAAEVAEEQIRARDYLTVWNEIRSTPPDPEAPANATASEVLWQTQRTLANRFNAELAEIAFTLPPNVPGAVLEIEGPEGQTQYVIPMVSGREIRPLSANEEQARRQEILSLYLDGAFASGDVEITDAWRGRVPVLPVLDPIFLQPPTPVPEQPTAPALPNEDAEQDSE